MITDELHNNTRDQWDAILQRFADAYHLGFYLFRNDGKQLAGKEIELPQEVHARLCRFPAETRGPGGGRMRALACRAIFPMTSGLPLVNNGFLRMNSGFLRKDRPWPCPGRTGEIRRRLRTRDQ